LGLGWAAMPPAQAQKVIPLPLPVNAPQPTSALEYFTRARERTKQRDTQGSIRDYSWAIALQVDYAEAYNNRGVLLAQLGDRPQALIDYTQAIRFKSDYAVAYNNRALLHLALGNRNLAIADFQKAADLFELQGDLDLQKSALTRIEQIQASSPQAR
jgi:tetratricopeptide (TPR) repeat protein